MSIKLFNKFVGSFKSYLTINIFFQTGTYNHLQSTFFDTDLPNLCNTQKTIHVFLTDLWKETISEYQSCYKNALMSNENVSETCTLNSFYENDRCYHSCPDNILGCPQSKVIFYKLLSKVQKLSREKSNLLSFFLFSAILCQ